MSAPPTGAMPALSIDAAIAETARRLCAIRDEHGPDAISFYVSGQMSLEAQYLANKLAKGFVRTKHIELNSRFCMASAASGYKLSLGADGPPGSYQDFDKADLFFVIGANMADCHPILFLRMMDRVKAGAKLIVVDPRRTATRRQGRSVPPDQARHRSRSAQRPAPSAVEGRRYRRGVHRRAHRGLGGDARLPRRLSARCGGGDHRPRRSRHPPGRATGSARRASG